MLVHGRVELEALAAETGVALETGDFDTVAGFVLAHMGTVPAESEGFEYDGHRFTIVKASPNRIESVRIERV